jgi:hypothetical protein
MSEFRTFLEGVAEDSWTLISGNRPIDVALARTVANFSNDGTTTFADDAAVVGVMGTSQSNLSAFCGATIDWENLRVIFHPGGHGDSGDSSLFGFNAAAAAASINASGTEGNWELKKKSARYRLDANGYPAWSPQIQNGDYAAWENADGEPHWISCHTYAFNAYVGNGVFDIGGSAAFRDAKDVIGAVWSYTWASNATEIYHHDSTLYAGPSTVYGPALTYTSNSWGCTPFAPFAFNRWDNKVYTLSDITLNFANPFFRWDRENKDRDGEGFGANDYIGNSSIPGRARQRAVILPDPGDATKRLFWQHRTNSDYIVVRDIERTDALCVTENRNYATALSPTDTMNVEYAGYCYDSQRNVIARWGGTDEVHHLALSSDFDDWNWSEFTTSPTGDTPPGGGSIYDGFEYIPAHDCYIAVDRNKDVYVYKPSGWTAPMEASTTRLTPFGTPGIAYGSFAGKTEQAAPAVEAVTRLGAFGIPSMRYGSFSGKSSGGAALTGAMLAAAATMDGAATVLVRATGAMENGASTTSGAMTVLVAATGALTSAAASIASAATVLVSGTGDLVSGAARISGRNFVLATITRVRGFLRNVGRMMS